MSSGIIIAGIAIIISVIALAFLFRLLYHARMLTKAHAIISFIALVAILAFGSCGFVIFDTLIATIVIGILAVAFITMLSIFKSLDTKYRVTNINAEDQNREQNVAGEKETKTE